MGKTSIEWTGFTWNPIRGTKGRHICQRVSDGCKNCYAAKMNVRFSGIDYVAGADAPRLDDDALDLPLRWRKPRTIFVCSMTDLFWDAIPDEAIDRVFAVMALTPRHTYQILTKRPGRMLKYLTRGYLPGGVNDQITFLWDRDYAAPGSIFPRGRSFPRAVDAWPLPNVWLGVSVEDQQRADERIPLLREVPAAVHFVSIEPLLSRVSLHDRTCRETGSSAWCPVCLPGYGGAPVIDWAIVGAESGPGARPMDEDWVRALRDECWRAGTAFFYKQRAIGGRKIPTPELDGRRWVEMPGGAR